MTLQELTFAYFQIEIIVLSQGFPFLKTRMTKK